MSISVTPTSTIERVEKLRHSKILREIQDKDTVVMFEDPLENDMVLNMGPQHPATHGVLRVLIRLEGETVVKCVPELGYLHRGYEKIAESSTYHEFIPHTDRLDYISPMANNVAICLAIEKLANIDVPVRGTWVRMLVTEMARISNHLLALGATAMDVGAMTLFLWTFTEREKLYDLFERICGARFTTSFARIGGVANDIPDDVMRDVRAWLNQMPDRMKEVEGLVNRNRIFVDRMAGIGYMPPEKAIQLGLTGPTLRGSGVARDLRRDEPYMFYDQVDFDVITHNDGDCYARYICRDLEIWESMKICHQCLDKLENSPRTPVLNEDQPTSVLPRKQSIYTKMEEMINDFMLINFCIQPPKGDVYFAAEGSKGELGFYYVSDGTGNPWKLKIRSPSSANLQALKYMCEGSMVSDVVAIIGSIDPVMGEADK
ncbi:MAG: NADH dehydrogenase (quinone) subunit D [Chlorobi bacterium]|nr:MAG: NADH dehydrogenase (quinone) subunit D [Bacteroidota bacterium]KXK35992.1 MAG: NADH dehydrogenase I subunit D [Chlorobi bacterium OLB6]MBE2265956.1 NADH dehydrogenase (quinone) subunit D [Flavobacteriales bacterium]MBL1161398.1 NADH dehydrogenase (quinone) subunit D [Chlorobiota bacterium]MBW7854045.1 NADH dehydrogenase (quinone) subunit D [Candidatus Kapabacteria bacterium]MCC6331124.1 NADH dehydrogenase (quinone) subunit D [Ignavibacteria bacterium]